MILLLNSILVTTNDVAPAAQRTTSTEKYKIDVVRNINRGTIK
jgi:hypothetical protein